jgi:hypothetical protein
MNKLTGKDKKVSIENKKKLEDKYILKLFNTYYDKETGILNLANVKKKSFDFNTLSKILECTNYPITQLILIGHEYYLPKLPNTLTVLNLQGKKTNQYFNSYHRFSPVTKKTILPESLIKIVFDDKFNCLIKKFPDKLKKVVFGRNFNQQLDNLPNQLKKLYFRKGSRFNKSVEKLPDSIEYLIFGDHFNTGIFKLPKSLIKLKFGERFNEIIHFTNSELLTELTFGLNFNKLLIHYPPNLKFLKFDYRYKKSLDNLPQSLKILYLHHTHNTKSLEELPEGLEILSVSSEYYRKNNKYPTNLRVIYGNQIKKFDKLHKFNLLNTGYIDHSEDNYIDYSKKVNYEDIILDDIEKYKLRSSSESESESLSKYSIGQ